MHVLPLFAGVLVDVGLVGERELLPRAVGAHVVGGEPPGILHIVGNVEFCTAGLWHIHFYIDLCHGGQFQMGDGVNGIFQPLFFLCHLHKIIVDVNQFLFQCKELL